MFRISVPSHGPLDCGQSFGVTGRNRTYSHSVNSRTLCLLSYDNKKMNVSNNCSYNRKGEGAVVRAVVEKNPRSHSRVSLSGISRLITGFPGPFLCQLRCLGFIRRCSFMALRVGLEPTVRSPASPDFKSGSLPIRITQLGRRFCNAHRKAWIHFRHRLSCWKPKFVRVPTAI